MLLRALVAFACCIAPAGEQLQRGIKNARRPIFVTNAVTPWLLAQVFPQKLTRFRVEDAHVRATIASDDRTRVDSAATGAEPLDAQVFFRVLG